MSTEGAQWLSGRVLDIEKIEGWQVRASPEALRCVLEQDPSSSAYIVVLVQPGKARPDMTELLLTGT